MLSLLSSDDLLSNRTALTTAAALQFKMADDLRLEDRGVTKSCSVFLGAPGISSSWFGIFNEILEVFNQNKTLEVYFFLVRHGFEQSQNQREG